MKLSRYFFALVAIAIILVIAFSSCKKTVVNASTQPQPDVGTVWIGEPDTGYIQYALNLNLRLSAIFEYNGTQTADITNWINFLKRAQQKGVKLRICPIPIAPNGPAYMDDRHAAVQLGIVSSFIQLLQTNGVKPCQIILDIEGTNAAKYCDSLVQFALGSTAARDTLVANALSVAGEDSAIALYQAFVNQMHSSGWKVGATTLNQIALERVGDNNIERVLGIPITGVSWDFVTYQAYRTLTYSVAASLGVPNPTSWFVYRFGQLAQMHYGTNGGLDIGIMGINASGGCYNSLSEWENDVAATRAAGLNPDLVAGFRMESADNNNPLPGDSTYWFTQLESAPAPAPPSSSDVFTFVYMEIYDTADVRLDKYLPH